MHGIYIKNLSELRLLMLRAQLIGAHCTAKRIELQIARLLNENNRRLDKAATSA